METNKIYQGHTLEVLKTFPAESINCVMTSPPYWALRDYGIDVETIWDADANCQHEWDKGIIGAGSRSSDNHNAPTKQTEATMDRDKRPITNFCSKCGAWKGQLGLEPTFDLYIKHLCDIFDEIKRVLRKDGTCWVNLGDTYANTGRGHKDEHFKGNRQLEYKGTTPASYFPKTYTENPLEQKCLSMIPFRFAIEMVNRGWILRNTIIWYKRNCMPSSVKDRFTVDFEYLFFFVKSKKYWFETQYEPSQYENREQRRKYGWHAGKDYPKGTNAPPDIDNAKEYGDRFIKDNRNKRCVWDITPKPFAEAHFAVYPEELCETPIKAGCPVNGIVFDPFMGSGTTALVALKQNKRFIGCELQPKYIEIAMRRLKPYLEQSKLTDLT